MKPGTVTVAVQSARKAKEPFGTGQRVQIKGQEAEYVVVRVNRARNVADLLLVSGWPSRLEADVALCRLQVVVDRRSPSTADVCEPIQARYTTL